MTKASVAKNVNYNIFLKFLSKLRGYFCSVNYRFWIISINMKNWCLYHQSNVCWVW